MGLMPSRTPCLEAVKMSRAAPGGRKVMVVITPRSIALRVEKFGACVLVFVAKS